MISKALVLEFERRSYGCTPCCTTTWLKRMMGEIDGFSELILELYGPESGRHTRSYAGVATLSLGL